MDEPPRRGDASRRAYVDVLRDGYTVVRRDHALLSMVCLQVVLMSAWAGFALLSQPFLARHGVPLGLFGVLSSAVMLASAVTGLASGRFVRRVGIARAFVAALVGAVSGLALLAAVDEVWAFVGFALTAAAIGVVHPAGISYVNERVDSSVRATVMSVAPFGESIATAITNTGAGVLGEASLRLAFAVLALVTALVGAAAFAAWWAADRAAPTRTVGP
jgi:MFS family permease